MIGAAFFRRQGSKTTPTCSLGLATGHILHDQRNQ
jgi:hypothetical protein